MCKEAGETKAKKALGDWVKCRGERSEVTPNRNTGNLRKNASKTQVVKNAESPGGGKKEVRRQTSKKRIGGLNRRAGIQTRGLSTKLRSIKKTKIRQKISGSCCLKPSKFLGRG